MSSTVIQPLAWHNETRKIKDLVPYEHNPRILTPAKKAKLQASIEKFNLAEIPAINLDDKIIAGHQRIKVLMALGRGDEVIDVRVPNRMLTETEFKEYNITSNVPVGFWDINVLDEAFDDVDLSDLGLNVDAIEVPEPDIPEAYTPLEDTYEQPEVIETDIVLGDLFEIGPHRLLCGDSTKEEDVKFLMNGEKADMIQTDPPYGIDYQGGSKKRDKIANDKLENFNKFLNNFYINLFKNTKEGGAIYVWHASSETHNFIMEFIKSGFLFKSYIVWNKNNSTFGRSDYHWKHEPAIYGWKSGGPHKWYGDRKQTTVWDVERPIRSDEHPTMKPIDLCKIPIQNSSKLNDIILDIFLGSGSTMVASHLLSRKCYGMELDPKYCQVILDRMLQLDPNLIIKKNGVIINSLETT